MPSSCRKFRKNRLVYHILRPIAYPFFWFSYRMKFIRSSDIPSIKGAAVLLGNHVNQWDPFIAAIGLKRQVHFIASDFVFRKPLLGKLLKIMGAVPKIKFRSDMASLRSLMDIVRCGGVVGIFPEGHANWSGKTLDIVPSTGKLIRLLKAPVIAVLIKGGHISRPRWHGSRLAPGETLEYRQILSPEQIKSMSVPQINQAIQNALDHNEWDYLREHPRRLPARGRAEGLEHTLFLCPDCHQYSSMISDDNELSCTACDSGMRIGPDGFPAESSFSGEFRDIAAWDHWQQERLETDIQSALDGGNAPIFSEQGVRIAQSSDGKKFDRHWPWGTLEFHGDRIVLKGKEALELRLADLSGIGVQNSEEIEFYVGNVLSKIEFEREEACSYKWYSAMTKAQSLLRIVDDF
jgi:1-acyl-sn-glycerol-3-phosphate acyltransferase